MRPFFKRVALGILFWFVFASAWSLAHTSQQQTADSQAQRLAMLKSKGTEASLSILPVRLIGRPFDRVTEVVGLLLERQGLKTIELSKAIFEPAPKADLQDLATLMGEFVKGHPVTTDYVLYAEINGSREEGLKEFRTVVADKAGAVVWTDSQTKEDKAFKELQLLEPLTICMLLVQRLSPQLGLNEETANAAKPGKMAAIMEERSGLPPASEGTRLPKRLKAMKESLKKATLVVFPVRLGGAVDAASAADLVKMINDAGLLKAALAKESPLLQSPQADPNEMKVLWDLAREFREYVKRNPVDADYVLYADYIFNPDNWKQGFVHFVVCNREGEWVIVQLANSDHPDYQEIKPASREGCSKLLFKRLEDSLR
jgi:hypothetical protein